MPNLTLAHKVAMMISSNKTESMHPNFFDKLDQQLRRRGFRIAASQRGVMGTHIYITRVEEPINE